MWTFTLDVPKHPLLWYDVEREIELLDMDYCIGKAFYTDYQWRKYLVKRKQLENELQVFLSDDRIELQYK